MALKQHLKPTQRSKPSLVGLLRAQLKASNEREKELLRQLALKDAQIQMVLEDTFFKPVFTKTAEPEVANTRVNVNDLTDSTQFSADKDKEVLEQEDAKIEEARAKFQEELNAIEAEQEAAHEEVPEHILVLEEALDA